MTKEIKLDQDAANIMIKARVRLMIEQPFFGVLCMRLKMVENSNIKTLNVDGTTVNYNPKFVKTLSTDLAKAAMAHEVMHCVLGHCGPAATRGKGLSPKKWNHATDYVINQILQDSGFKLGDGWLIDPQYKGMSAEQVYKMLPTDPDGDSLDELVTGDKEPAAQAQQDAEWKVAATQAANAAKAVGKMTSAAQAFVDQQQKPKIDWREELRRFVTKISKDDYAWQRPNRKMMAAGYYLPGLFSESMGSIVIASDESGSVDPAIMAAFSAEIKAIVEDTRPEKVIVQHFDTQIVKTEEFGPDDAFVLKRFANGGTDFRPTFKAVEAMAEQPECIIMLTDGHGPFPKHPPEVPTLFVMVSDVIAPFGDTLKIEV